MDMLRGVHSLTDGRLSRFQSLATFNNDTVYICVHIFVWVKILDSLILKSGMAGSHVNSASYLVKELPGCFPRWLNHFAFPTSNVGKF